MKKMTTDLFRFVTLRSPESIKEQQKKVGFVFPEKDSTAVFLKDLDYYSGDIDSEDFASRITGFAAFEKVSEVKGVNYGLHRFSQWLFKNKDILTPETVADNVPSSGYTDPSSEEINSLWDNLLYDILTNKNPNIRQMCLQMLVANYFLSQYSGYTPLVDATEKLRRLANAKVVIPKPYSKVKVNTTETLPVFQTGRRNFSQLHLAKLGQLNVSKLKALQKDLTYYENSYNADYAASKKSSLASYQSQVQTALSDYYANDKNALLDEKTEYQMPHGLIKEFEFNFSEPFDFDYTDGNSDFSAALAVYINGNNLQNQTLNNVKDRLSKEISDQKRQSAQAITRKTSAVSINGGIIDPKSSNFHDFALSIEPNGATPAFYFSMDAKYENAVIVDHSFKLTVNRGTPVVSDCPVYIDNKDNVLFVKLFDGAAITIAPCVELIFEGNLTLDNGRKIKFYKKTNSHQTVLTGVAITTSIADVDVELYGVNRIGVADFRKVEQEVCCYIPGEVSHIENIMAKEYKEKSSRSLTRAEDTFESTSEREIEELNDTTSTSRNELGSEISKVLESDREANVGFSTGASGEIAKFKFDASVHGDFSTSSSTSDSNNISRTYAEEVTRRALERVVQKTTVKRTSKIIKEFEENTKHGFDNREGENHVTGVYRWIDKVYKNRLVNYGKRLIYEFMVPEPARWYKEAIILKAEDDVASASENQSNGPITPKPTALKDNMINSAKDITRENYERLAALYGVNATPPQSQNKKISASYSEGIGDKDDPRSFPYSGLRTPEEYELIGVSGNITGGYKSRVKTYASFRLSIAGQNKVINFGRGAGNFSEPVSLTVSNIPGEIPVSVNTVKITSFSVNLELNCQWSENAYATWQQNLYADLSRAYDTQLQAYNDSIKQPVTDGVIPQATKLDVGAQAHFAVVRTELKRLCIEMLTKPFGLAQGKDFYVAGSCDVPSLRLSKNLDSYANNVKFFENAFDWDLMAENFYPYYWAKRCDWKDLFQSIDGNDSYFQKFLQSGMSRVIVPVKPGFEDAVTFFMETGNVWMGSGLVLLTDDEIYLSLADELHYLEGVVEGAEWETVVPTALTVIQASSVALDEGGLPCCNDDDAEDLNLDPSSIILSRLKEE